MGTATSQPEQGWKGAQRKTAASGFKASDSPTSSQNESVQQTVELLTKSSQSVIKYHLVYNIHIILLRKKSS